MPAASGAAVSLPALPAHLLAADVPVGRKIARHLARLHDNLLGALPAGSRLQLDELETYEGWRGVLPLTVALLIEKRTMLIVGAESAPIRPSGRMSAERREAVAQAEKRHGRRFDGSRRCLRRIIDRTAKACAKLTRVVVETDGKALYASLLRQALGPSRLVLTAHPRTKPTASRQAGDPLFRINLACASVRHDCGRLHRESWLVSKRFRFLNAQLAIWIAYRNYNRPRFNRDAETPAQLAGCLDRRLDKTQLLSWRQDWGRLRSIHPLSSGSTPVVDFRTPGRGP